MHLNGPQKEISADKVYVLIFGENGVQLDATYPLDEKKKVLLPGEYVFYTAAITGLAGKSEIWAFLESDPAFGIPLSRLRTLDKHPNGVLEAATSDGKRYFK